MAQVIDPAQKKIEQERLRLIVQRSQKLFAKQRLWLPLWQVLADHYHPQRAEFTTKRSDKSQYAENIFESTPVLHRRDFSLAMGAILRTPGKDWFNISAEEDLRNTEAAYGWFMQARRRIRSFLYNGLSNFAAAMRESDDDFCTFGNAVISVTENVRRNGLKFTCFHLRDCAWSVDADGHVNRLDRKEKFTLRNIVETFGLGALRSGDAELMKTDPETERELLICTMPLSLYSPEKAKLAAQFLRGADADNPGFCCVYIDEAEMKGLRCDIYPYFPYWVRRWEIANGEAYAYSPPAMLGLPDARMAQALAQITIEAAEKQLDPPLIAKRNALWEGANVYAGGITWIESEYEEKDRGEALRALDMGKNAGVGLDLRNDIRQAHAGTFYISKLSLPLAGEMTAYEVGQRIDEYIRTVGPVLEPFEADNARLLDLVFTILFLSGALGPIELVPPELQGADVRFVFETPVQQAYERRKMLAAKELLEFTQQVVAVTQKPEVLDNIEPDAMVREAAMIMGSELGWLVSPDDVVAARAARAQEAEVERQKQDQLEQIDLMTRGAQLAPLIANADQTLKQIMGPDWLNNLMGAQQQESQRLLPSEDEMMQEEAQAQQQPMALPAPQGSQQVMPRNGFAGPMPQPQAQQDDRLAQVLERLSQVLEADTMLITDKSGKAVGSRKVARSAAAVEG